MRMKYVSWLICLIMITAGCGGGETQTVEIGKRAPAFNLVALDGTEVSSESLEGEVVVLNFWATWCQPCLKEIPDLKEMAASKTKIVGIALDKDGARTVKPFVEKHGINYPILLGNEELFQRFNGFGIPHTVLLDKEYRIVKVYRGSITKDTLERDLEKIVQGS